MRCLRWVLTSVLGFALLFGIPVVVVSPNFCVAAAPAAQDKKIVTVWVNTRSGVYHCPGSRWYGRTKQGKYMSECDAIKDGYRPAYGKPCGSDCGQ